MPSRIHAICNPVLLFHVAIHSPAAPCRQSPSCRHHYRHLFYIRQHHHRSTNPRTGKAGTLVAGCAVGFMLHFLSPIKMQLRLFDKARVVPIVPLSRPYIPIPFIPTSWKCSGHYLRGRIAYREMSTSFSFSRCKSRLVAACQAVLYGHLNFHFFLILITFRCKTRAVFFLTKPNAKNTSLSFPAFCLLK